MLVGALEVHISWILKFRTELTNSLPRHAGVPPNVQDVTIGLKVEATALGAGAGLAQVILWIIGKPRVRALLVEELDHGVERVIVHNLLAAISAGIRRNGHTPVALARDTPIGTLLYHGANAVRGMCRIPLHVVLDLITRSLAQASFIHRDKPLVGSTEQHRMLAAPAMRIAVGNLLLHYKRTALAQELDDMRVGLIGIHAREGATAAKLIAHVELTVVINRHANIHALLDANIVVVCTVTRRVVDNAGTIVYTNVIGKQGHALNAIKDRLLVVQVIERLCRHNIIGTVHLNRRVVPTKLLTARRSQLLEHNLGTTVVLNSNVVLARLERNRLVGGNGPRRSCPNDEVYRAIKVLKTLRLGGQLKAHKNRGRRLIGVLNLSFSKSGMAVLAPMNRLVTTVNHAAIKHSLKDLDISSIVLVIQREIGIIPVAQNTQTAETSLLKLNVLNSKLVAKLTNLSRRGLVKLGSTKLLFYLVLNGLTMAIPTRNIRHLIALHGPVAIDDVLRNLIHRVADMNRAICIRRAVMQNKLLVSLILLQRLLVDLVILPVLKPHGLRLGKAGTHRKTGLWQVHGLLVLVGHDTPSKLQVLLHPI